MHSSSNGHHRPFSSNLLLTLEERAALLRMDFSSFLQRTFQHLHPAHPFMPNWHLDLIASKLEACHEGRIRRLVLNIPPRSMKSICSSVAFPAFVLGHNPSARILCVSYGQDLAYKHSLDCKSVMESLWYKALFPTRLSPQKRSQAEFATTKQGYRMASSVEGGVTGRGADWIIIDDPVKPNEALSDPQRNSVNAWYDNALYSRLNDKERGVIILLMQRLHLDDLTAHVLEQESWEVVSLPALAEEEETHLIVTNLGSWTHVRMPGEALHPERESRAALEQVRQSLGEYNFSAQYQQSPVPKGGGLVKETWFRSYEPHELPAKFDHVVQSWDTANKEAETSDFSVCTTWGAVAEKIYLLHVFRKRMDFPDLKRAVKDLRAQFNPSRILIEDKASGTQLIQDLLREGLSMIKGIKPMGDKWARMNAQTPVIENGLIHIPKLAPWRQEFIHELTSFPMGKYADQVDSTSQALEWIHGEGREPGGVYQYYKEIHLGIRDRNGRRIDGSED